MAGAASSGGRLACLPLADAEQLRERLLSMARAPGTAAAGKPAAPYRVASPDVPSGPPGAARLPERVLFRGDSGRLAGAITLSRAGAFAAIVAAPMPSVAGLAALIQVGSGSDTEQGIGELLGTRPLPSQRAPRSARWKAPLTYHFLAWDLDDHYVVASCGRVCRKTTWVPLEKVQSIRWVQGPLQRRLGLASVRLHLAGKRVRASIQDP